ncbi:MAG: sulfatase-like hydrolase/transferase [Opitutaceae bacterium]|nr:sulfatase-like hydrolase/transferase [Opitutaceae bacterium]
MALLVVLRVNCSAAAAERPNILWITCEDTSPHLGCYGDPLAATPVLDALARESVRFTQAFAYTGVCAPSRSCLITGVYPLRLGSQHMRSTTRLPETVKCFSEYLRAAGYYCSNNVKTDYNFAVPAGAWDESSRTAHWRKRRPGQPFFAVFNFTVSHQSQIFCSEQAYAQNTRRLTPAQRHDPAKVAVPPIHPDTPEFRHEWARHFDNVTAVDYSAGDVLAELARDGLAENTIVFFFSDHGTGMPAVKTFVWDASLRVPLLIRFPPRRRDAAPAKPGGTSDRLVSFVDFAPTVLSLCGLEIPAHMQGVPFLGPKTRPPRTIVFGGKDRQGERADTIRYVHDGRFHYLRNFQPHLPWAQHISYVHQHPSMQAWQRLHDAGELKGAAARFFETKPSEELYDVRADPWETRNLAGDSQYRGELERLRATCRAEMKRAGDLGLLPEFEMHARGAGRPLYDLATDPKFNPLDALLDAAWIANQRDRRNVSKLVALLNAGDAAVRWWGAVGLVALGGSAADAVPALRQSASDTSPDVRLAVAGALANLGHDAEALPLIREALRHDSALIRLAALNVADRLGARAEPLLPSIRAAALRDPAHKDASDYVGRMTEYVPERIMAAAARIRPSRE